MTNQGSQQSHQDFQIILQAFACNQRTRGLFRTWITAIIKASCSSFLVQCQEQLPEDTDNVVAIRDDGFISNFIAVALSWFSILT